MSMFKPLDNAPVFEAYIKQFGEITLGDGKHTKQPRGHSWSHDVMLNGGKIGVYTDSYNKRHDLVSRSFSGHIPGFRREDNGSDAGILHYDRVWEKRVDAHKDIPF